ncbi:MAG: hypothetical protein ACI9XC_001951 [Gammaproteobacteria bacterium]|jgi:hypothetical protein
MMIFKKALSRRAVLRGLGASLALPLLDGMIPALARAANPVTRLSYVYVPNGIMMDSWTPATSGADFELTPVLKELADFKDQFLVLSGLDGGPTIDGMGGGHPRASAMWLTGIDPKKSDHDVMAGYSVDQIAAQELGKHTQLTSLELGTENAAELVGAISGYSAAYVNTIAWRTPTTPLPIEHHPRAVFERLFGDGESTSPKERLTRIKENRSLLDSVIRDVDRLSRDLGPGDRNKLDQYLEAIRDIERRIQMAEQSKSQDLPEMERPVGIPSYDEHVKLMFDMQVLAFQTDLTRVTTFMMAREKSELVYHQLGQSEPHHALTHNRGIKDRMQQTVDINRHHARLFSYFLAKMRATQDGDGSLLDHSLIVYGSGLGDGDLHTQQNMPILLAGSGSGQVKKGGHHLQYPEHTPFANLHMTMLDMVGVPVESIGNSTENLELS